MSADRKKVATLILLVSIMTGCNVELQHNLDELQANEILIVLEQKGIVGKKCRDSSDSEMWMITVSEKDAGNALTAIVEEDLPRTKSKGFAELFQKDSMLPTAIQEKTKYISALCGELQQTLEVDDSIKKARVHLFLSGYEKSAKSGIEAQGSAAVFLKIASHCTGKNGLSDDSVKSLIASSVGGLRSEDVIVVRTHSAGSHETDPVNPVFCEKKEPASTQTKLMIIIAAALSGFSFITFGYVGLRMLKTKKSKHEVNA